MSIPRHQQQFFIRGSYIHLLSEVVAKWNIPVDKLLWGTGIEQDKLLDLTYKVSFASAKKVIQRAIELTNESGIGFHMGTQFKIGSHGILGFTVSISATMQQALEIIKQYAHIQSDFISYFIEIDQDTTYCYVNFEDTLEDFKPPINSIIYEYLCIALLIGFVQLSKLFFSEFRPIIDLQCKRPDYFDRFQDILTASFAEIHYEQPYTRVHLPTSILNQPLNLSDPSALEQFKILCQKELEALSESQDIIYQVKHHIYDEVEGLQSIDNVARKLNLTKRTLQRMLQEKGENFQNIFNTVRKEKAEKLLQQSILSREEIAKQLGYSCTSSFNRAMKNWGMKQV